MKENTSAKQLGTRAHEIRLDYFASTGPAGMVFKYQGPDSQNKMVVVPKRFLWAPKKFKARECPRVSGSSRKVDWNDALSKKVRLIASGPITGLLRGDLNTQSAGSLL